MAVSKKGGAVVYAYVTTKQKQALDLIARRKNGLELGIIHMRTVNHMVARGYVEYKRVRNRKREMEPRLFITAKGQVVRKLK